MIILASPDQIFRSTATSSTCRVATTLLGIHRRAVRLGYAGPQGHGDGSLPTLAACRGPPARRSAGSARAAVQQRPATDAQPRMPHTGARRPVLGGVGGTLLRFDGRI